MFREFLWFLSRAPATSPTTIFVYGLIVLYGIVHIKNLKKFKGPLRFLLLPVSAASLLLIIIFIGEIFWWSIFTLRYNVIFTMYRYQIGAFLWIIALSTLYLISTKMFPELSFNKRTVFGFSLLFLYILILFVLSPKYLFLNWRDALVTKASDTVLFLSFIYPLLGKMSIVYIYHSMWKK